jgi:hypothetical protein
MKFTLEINCDNAAFCDEDTGESNPGPEVARMLAALAYRLPPDLEPEDNGAVYDVNGNKVGKWSMED